MGRIYRKRARKAGLPPGTLIFDGEHKVEKTRITIFDYDEVQFQEKEVQMVEDCFPSKDEPTVTWINIDGVHDVETVEKIGEHFGIHPLVQEDIVHTGQRPKMEDFDDYLYIVLKMLFFDDEKNEISAEQISLIVGDRYVISFQERKGDVFEPIRERLRGRKGRIIKQGADYLAYALLDIIVDNYFSILEKTGDKMESLEEELITNPSPKTLAIMHRMKREMIFLRKSIWPLREVISGLERDESPIIKESTHVFLRDVYDHTIQVIDTVEALRDMIGGMLDIYLSSVSNRMNEVMKVLTIIATIFIPLTFIAGVYGMNFENMPELRVPWAYPVVWGVMGAVGLLMVLFFRRKRWL